MDTVNTILSYANIVLALVLIAASGLYVYRFRNYLTWIKGLYMFVGLYILTIYLIIVFCDPTQCSLPDLVSAMLRPGITLVLATMASGALYRLLMESNT